MEFNPTRWVIGRQVMISQGADESTASRLAVVPGALGMPDTQAIVLSAVIGRNNAAPPVVTSPTPTPDPTPEPVPEVVVPGVVGALRAAAEEALTAAGFAVSVTVVGTSPAGEPEWMVETVVAQEPGALTSAAAGSTVTLDVSQALAQVPVPNVVGEAVGAARATLAAVDLEAEVRPAKGASSAPAAAGSGPQVQPTATATATAPAPTPDDTWVVSRTEPLPKALADKGSTVVLHVVPPPTP